MTEKLTRRAGQYRLLLYVPEIDADMVQDFVEKCRREDSSASRELLEYIRSRMPREREVTESESILCYSGCGKKATIKAKYVSHKVLWSCAECFQNALDRGLVSRVLRRLEPEGGV